MKRLTFFRRIVPFGVIAAVMILGCKKDNPEEPEPVTPVVQNEEVSVKGYKNEDDTEKVEMKQNVILTKNDINEQFKANDTINKTISFEQTQALNQVKVGDILYKPFNDETGYALKVTGIKKTGNEVTYTYETASPSDVFDELHQKMEFKIDTTQIKFYDIDKQLTQRPVAESRVDINLYDKKNVNVKYDAVSGKLSFTKVLWDYDKNYKTTHDQLALEFSAISKMLHSSVIFEHGIFQLSGTPKFDLELKFTALNTEGDMKNWIKKYKESGVIGKRIQLVSIPLLMANPGAKFIVNPTLDFYIVFNISLEGKLEVTLGYSDFTWHFNVYDTDKVGQGKDAVFKIVNAGKANFDIDYKSELKTNIGVGLGLKVEIPWAKYEKNKKSYVGFFSDVTYDFSIEAKKGGQIFDVDFDNDKNENFKNPCTEILLKGGLNWNNYAEGKLGIFKYKIVDFKLEIPKIELNENLKFEKPFEICETVLFKLEKEKIELPLTEEVPVRILVGSEKYTLTVENPDIAEAYVKENVVYIKSKKVGDTKVTVTDTKTQKNGTIAVSVKAKPFTISTSSVSIEQGENAKITITSGNGSYQVKTSDTAVATATEVKAGMIAITGKGQGQTSVLVTDTQTGQTKTIAVTVTPKKPTHPDLAVSKSSVTLEKDNTETLTITSSGNFTAVMGNTSVASVQKLGTNQVKITALKQGETTLTITDTQTGQTKTVAVKVTEKPTFNINPNDVVFVEGGSFLMGSPEGKGYYAEHPQHKVTLSSFKISKYEVTNTQFAQFLNVVGNEKYYNGNMQIERVGTTFRAMSGYENHPVMYVTWYEADAYAKWAGGRLPTEAEWEYAARGGNKSKGYEYSGSNNIEEVAWYSGNSNAMLQPVGIRKPNELGIYDMSGNVWEWCSDGYGTYTAEDKVNPKGGASGSARVLRGGDCNNSANYSRVAHRDYDHIPWITRFIGFRVVFP